MRVVTESLSQRVQQVVDLCNEQCQQLRDLRKLLVRIEEAIRWQSKADKNETKTCTEQHWRRLGAIAARRKIAMELREILNLPQKSS